MSFLSVAIAVAVAIAMVYSLGYRRPSHVTSSSANSLSGSEKQDSINESIQSNGSSMSHGIPSALSFDRIIAGGTCPVCVENPFVWQSTDNKHSPSPFEIL